MIDQLQPKHILLVEDLIPYQDLVIEALETFKSPHRLHLVNTGEEALEFLYQKKSYSQSSYPDLILLDLNLPKMSGHELLSILKTDIKLKMIPVIMFTNSMDASDIGKSYQLQANCYIYKPNNLDQFIEVIQAILTFWFTIAVLPSP